ncbi:hypothetical protein CRUP_007155, partial [Coryphaenoides rupestris]
KTMTRIPTRTASATLALLFLMAAIAEQKAVHSDPSSLTGGGNGNGNGREIVRKERYPYHSRQKREWIWNSYYIIEETELLSPQKIGKLKSSKPSDGMTFKLQGEGANSVFTVNRNGDLFVIKKLDREEKSSYTLTALMYNSNNEPVEAAGEFVVQVTDINDHIPVFPVTYNGSILERSRIGTKVVEATATDADDISTVNAMLRYTLRPEGDRSAFKIDSITGGNVGPGEKEQVCTVVEAKDMRGMSTGTTATTSVTITIGDINDNMATFTRNTYDFSVPENQRLEEKIGTLTLNDEDEIQNKDPVFTNEPSMSDLFNIVRSPQKDGYLMLKQALDYETRSSYSFIVNVHENNLQFPADNKDSTLTKAKVTVRVLDVDEAPVFSKPAYVFSVMEETMILCGGRGQSWLHSLVKVTISVQDVNDNAPELVWDDIFVCENDMAGTVPHFRYFLANPSENFTITNNTSDNTAVIRLKQGSFRLDDPTDYSLGVRVDDGGRPLKSSNMHVPIKVCRCDSRRIPTQCKAAALRMGVQKQPSQQQQQQLQHHPLLPPHQQHHYLQPPLAACKGDMAVMIEAKKDEADHDRDGVPYDTLHVYDYEGGVGSLAGSLSSLESSCSSTGSDRLEYDFLNDWGPRFRTLAELYGVDEPDY